MTGWSQQINRPSLLRGLEPKHPMSGETLGWGRRGPHEDHLGWKWASKDPAPLQQLISYWGGLGHRAEALAKDPALWGRRGAL